MTISTASASKSPVPKGYLALVALSLATQPVTTDLYIPAIPAVTRALAPGNPGLIGLSMTLLVLGFGVGQLIAGPLADRYGRRPCLLAGLWLLCLGGVLSALAGSAVQLNMARMLQGFALAPVLVASRASVRDRFSPAEGPALMSRALMGLGGVALFAPVIGAWVVQHLGWRWSLVCMAVYAGGLALASHRSFTESFGPEARSAAAAQAKARGQSFWQGVLEVMSEPHFRAWTTITALTWLALFSFLLLSPLVYIDYFGLQPTAYGWIPASGSLVYILGGRWCQKQLRRITPVELVRQAAWFGLAGAVIQVLGTWWLPRTLWPLLLGHYLFVWAHATHQPCGQAGSISRLPHAAGRGSAWSGFLMMFAAFVVGQLAASFVRPGHPFGAWPMVLPLAFGAVGLVVVSRGALSKLR